ncbi:MULTISPECIES: glycine zipper 2TM domain-containing protein [unclassified Ruegeria]|uniref:glycine zipper 2TM domain-containing protein n=1 Tax=unclassified Ruegeria TaxID=2625375 RepID=UPI0014890DEF|nr:MULTISPECIES: glycine zipper 2TM domain-containing protein [unclassified Ruegeria]
MKLKFIAFGLVSAGTLAACGPAPTPQQQAARQHEIACLSGTLGGALIGGAIGNQFGGGSGKAILTAAGAAAGGVSGQRYAC